MRGNRHHSVHGRRDRLTSRRETRARACDLITADPSASNSDSGPADSVTLFVRVFIVPSPGDGSERSASARRQAAV
jgi:hypothetical protein